MYSISQSLPSIQDKCYVVFNGDMPFWCVKPLWRHIYCLPVIHVLPILALDDTPINLHFFVALWCLIWVFIL